MSGHKKAPPGLLILLLLVATGVGAVLIAWGALMHAWRYL